MEKTKHDEYLQTLETFQQKEREAQQSLHDNRLEYAELKQMFLDEVENGSDKTKTKIKLEMNKLDEELKFLHLEAEAFTNLASSRPLLLAKEAAIKEQQDLLFDTIKDFDHLEDRFSKVKDEWLALVAEAHDIRRESQGFHSRLTQLVEITRHNPTAGDRISIDKMTGFIFFDNKKIQDTFRFGRK